METIGASLRGSGAKSEAVKHLTVAIEPAKALMSAFEI
jgi:hypothetical protein